MKETNPKIAVVGAGGIGAFLLQSLLVMDDKIDITIFDGDEYEEKNTSRQFISRLSTGKKTEIFKQTAKCEAMGFITKESMEALQGFDLIVSCVDNNAARKIINEIAEEIEIPVIYAMNEDRQADVFYVDPKDPKEFHPFKRFPNLRNITDETPWVKREETCTNALDEKPQTATANLTAAALASNMVMNWLLTDNRMSMARHYHTDGNGISTTMLRHLIASV